MHGGAAVDQAKTPALPCPTADRTGGADAMARPKKSETDLRSGWAHVRLSPADQLKVKMNAAAAGLVPQPLLIFWRTRQPGRVRDTCCYR